MDFGSLDTCTNYEISTLINQLASDQGGKGLIFLDDKRAGTLTPHVKRNCRTSDLGDLEHCWFELEGPAESMTSAVRRMKVGNSLQFLQISNSQWAIQRIRTINSKTADLRAGKSVGLIILAYESWPKRGLRELVIQDGNHSAVAIWEYAKELNFTTGENLSLYFLLRPTN